MSDAIQPIEQREINFYNDKVTAVVASNNTIYVPVKPLCELIGVDWSTQHRKIQNDPVLADEMRSMVIRPQTSTEAESSRPKSSTMVCIPLNYLNGWLFSINANRVKDEIKDVVIRYQRDCYNILFNAFSTGVAVRPDNDIMQSEAPAAVSFRTLMNMAKLAREQYYMGLQVEDNSRRIGLIEAQLSNPAAYVTQEQAQLISGAVKAIATVLGKSSGRNEFGAVYGELYARYGVTSYKNISSKRFDDVMGWLRDWWRQLTDGRDLPF